MKPTWIQLRTTLRRSSKTKLICSMNDISALEILHRARIDNPIRLKRLIIETIKHLELNLSGLSILTEAASGPYVVTPIIAALANADRVIALTRDSSYARTGEVIQQTRALESLCGIERAIEIRTDRSPDIFSQADVITNLGFVRPLSADIIALMKPTAVIPLMYESWEFRPSDVDLEACRQRGIRVVGTNEEYPGLEVFEYCGWLAVKMLLNAQIEMHKSQVVIVSSDKFGSVIERRLQQAGVVVTLVEKIYEIQEKTWQSIDALIVADYQHKGFIIGPEGDLSTKQFADLAPTVTVIQYTGLVDTYELQARGIHVYPGIASESQRMAFTLAALGPRPVIELHAAGLKVGETAIRQKQSDRWQHLSQEVVHYESIY
jgi:hypothetical protein